MVYNCTLCFQFVLETITLVPLLLPSRKEYELHKTIKGHAASSDETQQKMAHLHDEVVCVCVHMCVHVHLRTHVYVCEKSTIMFFLSYYIR